MDHQWLIDMNQPGRTRDVSRSMVSPQKTVSQVDARYRFRAIAPKLNPRHLNVLNVRGAGIMTTMLVEHPALGAPASWDKRTETPQLLTVQDTPLAVVAHLARPQKCNAISLELIKELDNLVATLLVSGSTKPFVLRGSGKWFTSGGDLRQFAGFTSEEAVLMAHLMSGVLQGIERLPGPTVAALNGPAIGGGIELALAFDLRVAADSAYLRFGQTRMGITTGWQGIERLCRLVGYSSSIYLLLSGSHVPAGEALRLGLVNAVWPAESFDAELDALLCSFVDAGEAGLAMKHVLREAVDRTEFSSGELERQLLRALWERPERRAAMTDALGRGKAGRA
jgi:enoyl-CoA hydratase